MEKKRRQPKKLNNDGMTLMEILVATIIFSMVSVVFLRSFVYAFQMNEQAKQKQYSMVLAQSLMESVKAYDVTVLDEQFDTTSSAPPFTVYDLKDGATKLDASISGENRTYSLRDVVYQPGKFGTRYKYDVDVFVEPYGDPPKYEALLVKAQDVNAYSDAIYVEGDDEQYKLRDAIITELANQGHTGGVTVLDTSKISAKRTINVEISGDDKVTVKSVYEYSVNNYPIIKTGGVAENVSFSGTVDATDTPITCYDKTAPALDGAVVLTGLYFYYFPAYKNAANQQIACSSDEIIITNESDTLKNIYLLKQENPALSQAEIDASEGSYSPAVTIKNNTTANELKVFHNLEKQLHGGFMVAPPPSFTPIGSVDSDMKTPWEIPAKVEADGKTPDETTLLYKVTVKVYRSGTIGSSEPICEIVGSTNAK